MPLSARSSSAASIATVAMLGWLASTGRIPPAHTVIAAARAWWEGALNATRPVGLTWVAILGFIRIATHRQVLANPLPAVTACAWARAWLAQPYVSVIDPGPRHAEILVALLESLGSGGNLTTDAHLAAAPWPLHDSSRVPFDKLDKSLPTAPWNKVLHPVRAPNGRRMATS